MPCFHHIKLVALIAIILLSGNSSYGKSLQASAYMNTETKAVHLESFKEKTLKSCAERLKLLGSRAGNWHPSGWCFVKGVTQIQSSDHLYIPLEYNKQFWSVHLHESDVFPIAEIINADTEGSYYSLIVAFPIFCKEACITDNKCKEVVIQPTPFQTGIARCYLKEKINELIKENHTLSIKKEPTEHWKV